MAEIEKPGSSAQMADSSGAPSCCSARMEEKELSFYISNHDQSPVHRVIHPIVGKTNFVFDAKGVMENIRGEAIALLVKDSQNITVRNVIFDWERPTMTEARITGFADGETVVEVDGKYCPMSVENLLWRNNRYEYNTLYRGCEEPPFVLRKCRNVTIDGRKCAADTCFVPASGRVESDFGGGWTQKKEDGAWSREKTFTLPPSAENQMVFLDIVGKGTAFEVALNGMSLGSVNSSQASARINLTPAIKRPGEENHIVFKCRDRAFEGRAVKLVRTAPVHIGFKGVEIDAKTQNDGSVMVEVKVDVKGPLPFVKSINAEKGVWGGDVRVESRVIGEEGLCIRKPKTAASGGECPYRLETKLYYVGDLVDVVTNTFKVGSPRGAKTHSSGVAR